MKFQPSTIPDVLILKPEIHGDERGFFMETFRYKEFKRAGIGHSFVQDNHSKSMQGVLRGLHYQIKFTQGKLVRVITGEIFDVAVDLRRNSSSFGKWVGTYLSSENKYQVWVPPGFAHGFYVLSDWAEIVYKSTQYWSPKWERILYWNDPDIKISWPLIGNQPPILSERDRKAPRMRDLRTEDLF